MSKPLCFVLIPLGTRIDNTARTIPFDAIYQECILPALEKVEMEPIRYDGTPSKINLEQLLFCDFAMVDISLADEQVFYQLGVRHTVRPYKTMLMSTGETHIPVGMDHGCCLSYPLNANGALENIPQFIESMTDALLQLKTENHTDSSLFLLFDELNTQTLDHEKTDIFFDHVVYSQKIKVQLQDARQKGLDAVKQIEIQLGEIKTVTSGILVDLFLSYRATDGYKEMISLAEKMPLPLAQRLMIQEQLAFALNRNGQPDEAEVILEKIILQHNPSSETYALLGRIYKDRYEATLKSNNILLAKIHLEKAIDFYLKGFHADWRDTLPGINAVTLLTIYNWADPRKNEILPIVTYSVKQKMANRTPDYWDYATLLELAVLDNNQAEAQKYKEKCLEIAHESWKPQTTARNLAIIREAMQKKALPTAWIKQIEDQLTLKEELNREKQTTLPAEYKMWGPKDILEFAIREKKNYIDLLFKIAGEYRDVMDYARVINTCDIILAAQDAHGDAMEKKKILAKALGLKTMAITRTLPEKRGEAIELLKTTVTLLEKEVSSNLQSDEEMALLGRLFKDIWRFSWFQNNGRLFQAQVNKNMTMAYREIRFLQKAIYYYIRSYIANKTLYPGVNIVSLLAVEKYLLYDDPMEAQKNRYGLDVDEIAKEVFALADATIANPTQWNDYYWALVSRAELKLVLAHENPEDNLSLSSALVDLDEAQKLQGPSLFSLDSTLQQMRLFLELGFKGDIFGPAFEKLDENWKLYSRKAIKLEKKTVASSLQSPAWLNDLFALMSKVANPEETRRWNDYKEDCKKARVFGDLAVKWEPIESLTPRLPVQLTQGFELLGMDYKGASYGALIGRANAAEIDITDLNLALFALQLRTVRQLRILMQNHKGEKNLHLFFSLNFDYYMMLSSALRNILKYYLTPDITTSSKSGSISPLFFEISETFPSIPKDILNAPDAEEQKKKLIDSACDELKTLLNTYNLKLVLDDSNEMDPYVKKNLESITWKTKADSKYTGKIMKLCMPAKDFATALKKLGNFAVKGKHYVIEGVENSIQYDFLQHDWPDTKYPQTGLQGYRITVSDDLKEFFEPLHNDPEQPRGYRLKSWVDDRLGLL